MHECDDSILSYRVHPCFFDLFHGEGGSFEHLQQRQEYLDKCRGGRREWFLQILEVIHKNGFGLWEIKEGGGWALHGLNQHKQHEFNTIQKAFQSTGLNEKNDKSCM